MRGLGVLCSAVVAFGGCGGTEEIIVSPTSHAPRSTHEREAAEVVGAYLSAVETRDGARVCALVGGGELDAFRCRTRPRVPRDRQVRIDSPVEVDGSDVIEDGEVPLFASVAGESGGPAVFFRVTRARGRLRVTLVEQGGRI